ETDITGRSLKAQMKYADKTGARYVAVLGENERLSGVIKLKDMANGTEEEINISELTERLGR
ncbi:MAG TPA: His/Gly/Thr/Pro-type tRNA ligase C-terminal domain-containing protein, partial [Clostridia bacterium]|nr:His/Gly/Thr/Pro-type tRNA ligase C-terminal domain-containing protein [Clostridia bacterium]